MSDWARWTGALFRGVSLGVDEWRVDAEFRRVRILGGLAIAAPGTLHSPVDFTNTVRTALQRAKAPAVLADAVSEAVWHGWKEWADGVSIPALPWYPAFFAWPGASAPPMPNVPTPLALCVSTGLGALGSDRLAAAIRSRLGGATVPGPADAIDDLAADINRAFSSWLGQALVTLAFGVGTAPVSFLTPMMPVQGTLLNNGRGCLAAAAPFPDTPPP